MKQVHLIGNAHLDPVWLWRWQEGFAEIKATFRSALDRMKEFTDFKFTSACGAYYMWIEQSDPAMFEEIRQRVREGRWELVGGWIVQPDCNIPCGESFARHALIVQRYFAEKFGKMAVTGYNVDSFGHNGSLPMILSHSRMKHYVFMRPGKHEKTLPSNLFLWESADGSRVTAYRIPYRYCITEKHFDLFGQIKNDPEPHDEMAFFGVGNHGGGPTVELLQKMHAELDGRFAYSITEDYFAGQDTRDLPVVRDDLQFHAKGCYSACSEIKQSNRLAEQRLLGAERMSVLSAHLIATPYPAADMNRAWRNVLFNQFHDILGGCSIREAYADARLSHGEAMAIADRQTNLALQQIGWNIDTVGGDIASDAVSAAEAERLGTPLVVFNPHAYPVMGTVQVRTTAYGSVTDAEGRALPLQTVRASRTNGKGDRHDRLFCATVPPLGYTVYRLRAGEAAVSQNSFTVGENFVSNGLISLCFDPETGELCSLRDVERGTELLAAPTRIALYDDEANDTWAHGTVAYDKELPVSVTGSAQLIESGPVRATLRTVQSFGQSRVIRDYSLTAKDKTVTVRVKLDHHETFRVLKFVFPVAASGGECLCKIPFGSIRRPTDGSEQVCGDWFCLHDGKRGLTVANDSKHSFDAKGNDLGLTVLRSALYADHYGVRDEFCEHMEQGEHQFSYSLRPFEGIAAAERQAEVLQAPLLSYVETFHRGNLPLSFSGMAVNVPNVTVTAIKPHVSGVGIVLRCLETEGRDTETEITLLGTRFVLSIGHNAVKTLWLRDGTVTETDFLE